MFTEPEAGDLLIAPPMMADQRFESTVIFLTKNHQHSMGFCLNRPTEHKAAEIVEEIGIELDYELNLYWGGPVFPNTVWMLHERDWWTENTLPVDENWSMTSHINMFKMLSDGEGPERYRLFFGCCTWGPNQLMGELSGEPPWTKKHSWLTLHRPDPNWLLSCDTDHLWKHAATLCSKQAVSMWMS